MTDRPFVIFTLQRTGGTNLARWLLGLASHPVAPDHEPFLGTRCYGGITRHWREAKDVARLRAEIAALAAEGICLKHTADRAPPKLTQVLVEESVAAGQVPVILYRRDRLQRALSLEFARRSQVWGPALAHRERPEDEVFAEPLDVEKAVAWEALVSARLDDVWTRARAHGAAPVALAYEELYGPDAGVARAGLGRVLAALGHGFAEGRVADMADRLRDRGDQGTRDKYARFEGRAALAEALAALPPFVFDAG